MSVFKLNKLDPEVIERLRKAAFSISPSMRKLIAVAAKLEEEEFKQRT